LAVPGLKYASDGHDLPPGYIYSNVYTLASANSGALGRAEVEKEASRNESAGILFATLIRRCVDLLTRN